MSEKTTVESKPFWVAHSAYSSGAWRGLEKCIMVPGTKCPELFDSKEDCEVAIAAKRLDGILRPVPITLNVPQVGQLLAEHPCES
jgi:hypothetical protein